MGACVWACACDARCPLATFSIFPDRAGESLNFPVVRGHASIQVLTKVLISTVVKSFLLERTHTYTQFWPKQTIGRLKKSASFFKGHSTHCWHFQWACKIQHPLSIQKQYTPSWSYLQQYQQASYNTGGLLKLCSSMMEAGTGCVNDSSSILLFSKSPLNVSPDKLFVLTTSFVFSLFFLPFFFFAQSLWQRPEWSCWSCLGTHIGMHYWESAPPQTLPAIPARNQIQPASKLSLPLFLSFFTSQSPSLHLNDMHTRRTQTPT